MKVCLLSTKQEILLIFSFTQNSPTGNEDGKIRLLKVTRTFLRGAAHLLYFSNVRLSFQNINLRATFDGGRKVVARLPSQISVLALLSSICRSNASTSVKSLFCGASNCSLKVSLMGKIKGV